MKILQVVPAFIPAYSYGGILNVCYSLSKELVLRGHEVTVITTDAYDETKRIELLEEYIDGIRVLRFRNLSNKAAKRFSTYLPIGFWEWVKKNIITFDIVHCHDTLTYQNIVVSYQCRKKKIPYLLQTHGNVSEYSIKNRFAFLKLFLLRFLSSMFINANGIIAITEKEKKDIINIFPKCKNKIFILPNGIHLHQYENVKKTELFNTYSIPHDHKIIAFIGRIQKIKGLDISLDILSKLKSKIDFTFLIIGPDEGEEINLIDQAHRLGIESNVKFIGQKYGKEKLEIMKSCDLFLFTSRSEALPLTVLEVASLGVPQVISDRCNVASFLKEADAGYVIPLYEKEKFVNAIIDIFQNQEIHQKFVNNGKQMVIQKFEMNLIITKYEEIMHNIINENVSEK